ncbi:MAG: Ig-like domain-containing protein [Thaumarchaeota archaeon]|nr:Ig-like domain-containing protein [Nitrososphaerota archaeon]MCL5316677.1 Ig-like domain-containing protein [Nitrososphaerota archaeon]
MIPKVYTLRKRCFATVVVALLILSVFAVLPMIPQASPQKSDALILAVTPAPNTIPANGGEYNIVVVQMQNSTGSPVPAPTDTQIILSSSKLEVGSVESTLTIVKGTNFAIAKFRSTTTPGATTITAAATGFTVGTATITTIDPSSSPMKLVVQLSPKQLPPETNATGLIVVQLSDANGVLARATDPILVSLSSSIPSIAKVDSSITIDAGQSFGQAFFYTAFTPGTTKITASASGYSIGSDTLTIRGSIAAKLAVYSAPPQIPERAGANTSIVIQLQDSNGVPVRAPSDIRVAVTSSNTTVGSTEHSVVTIKSGDTDSMTRFNGRFAGTAQITATAQKYSSGFTDVNVVRAGLADTGRLAIYIAPPAVLPDDSAHRAVFVELRNANDRMARASRDISVHLASSSTDIGSVDSDVIIPSGSTYGVAAFHSTHAAGTTTITASAADFRTASTKMNVAGSVPTKISVEVVPNQLPSDGQVHRSLVLQLQADNGEPVNAPTDIVVTLSSTRTDIGGTDGTVVLQSGKPMAIADFRSTLVAGTTTISASASGYIPGSVDVKTVQPTPSKLTVITSPSTLTADGQSYNAIVIQIQDANGVPAQARKDIPISISSSNPAIGEANNLVTLHAGETFVRAVFTTTNSPGTTTISALSSGFVGSSAKLTTALYPLTADISTDAATINATSTIPLMLSVKSSGVPVSGAAILWKTTNGTIIKSDKSTDESGTATAEFRNNAATSAIVTAVISKTGFSTASDSVTIKTKALPLRLIISSAPSIVASAPTDINATVLSGNTPISNVTLDWTATHGSFARKAGATGANGIGRAVFFSNDAGSVEIKVISSKAGYNSTSASLTINVTPASAGTDTIQTAAGSPGSAFFGLNFFVLIGIIAVVVAAVGAVVFFMIRRRRRGAKGGNNGEGFGEGDIGDILGEG